MLVNQGTTFAVLPEAAEKRTLSEVRLVPKVVFAYLPVMLDAILASGFGLLAQGDNQTRGRVQFGGTTSTDREGFMREDDNSALPGELSDHALIRIEAALKRIAETARNLSARDQDPVRRWEYCAVRLWRSDPLYVQDNLNSWGDKGWGAAFRLRGSYDGTRPFLSGSRRNFANLVVRRTASSQD